MNSSHNLNRIPHMHVHARRDRACPVSTHTEMNPHTDINTNADTNTNTEKFKNKYRTTSTRLQYWDYRWAGAYFITICTHQKTHYFGDIINGQLHYSPIGAIADVLWHEIKNHQKNVSLGEFVVMPNHIHGILILNEGDVAETNANAVETGHALSLLGQHRFQNIGKKSVSSIIGGYKSAVTKHANRLVLPFAWQTRFYDHIIRNEADYERIAEYIVNNPLSWAKDQFWSEHE